MSNLAKLRVIVFDDGGLFVAQCLDHDIVAQAESLDEALDRLELTIEAEIAMRASSDLNGIPRAPNYYQELWKNPSLKIARVNVAVDNCVPPFDVHFSKAA